MACKMLFFDYRESEEKFFNEHKFDSYEIKFFKDSLNEVTIGQLTEEDLETAMMISVNTSSKIDDNVVSQFKNLRVISTRSTSYDHINLNSCIRKNIALINVDSYGTNAVAQFTLGIILQLIRQICVACHSINNPLAPKSFCGRDLDNVKIGVIGTGVVGSTLCKYLNCLGADIFAYDTKPNKELVDKYCVQYIKFEDILKVSDIVVLLIPYTEDNYHKFSYDEFKQMKHGSYFINITRGEFVDNEALLEIAKTGKFKGIALDAVACPNLRAFDGNPKDVTSDFCIDTYEPIRELAKLPNVIITPRMAYDTQESVDYKLKRTFEALGDFLQGGRSNRVF
ncbi:hypothetical protein IJ541_07675 [bacterium]|nr:hypothetical protein [bacterium]